MESHFAKLVFACIQREFPNQPAHVVQGADDLKRPRALHPAFYGCYDWHSAVHGHWLAAHLLRNFPAVPEAGALRDVLSSHFSAKNLQAEADYLQRHAGFERPYGWAWLLKLAHELGGWDDTEARRWRAHLGPLTEIVEARYLEWLPKQTYPIRAGVHTNTAFGLGFALDYAKFSKKEKLARLIVERSIDYYGKDRDYPAGWEPGGNDFLSPCLVEADLMRRVKTRDFPRWFKGFIGEMPKSLLAPAVVSDRSDGQLAHLDGLNLSRAWCFFYLARFVPNEKLWLETARRHLKTGLVNVASGNYAGEHWLATFAALASSAARASEAGGSAAADRG